jgi:hypothetical protein
MKKILAISAAALCACALTWLMLPHFSAYREWRTKIQVRITDSTEMELQDAWVVRSSNDLRLFRIRARWLGPMPMDDQIITASLTDKNAKSLYTKKWYVPLSAEAETAGGNLFIWEFELKPDQKLEKNLILQMRVRPKNDRDSDTTVTEIPLRFFGTETTSFSSFPFRTGN